MNIKAKWWIPRLGILEIVLMYLTFCVTTIAYKGSIFVGAAILVFLFTMISYIAFHYLVLTSFEFKNLSRQLHTINTVCFIGLGWLLLRDMQNVHFPEHQKLLLLIFFLISIICEIIYFKKNAWEEWGMSRVSIGTKLKENIGIIGILLIFCLLSIYTGGTPYKWDSRLYYISSQDLDAFSISSLAIYGHIAQTFGILMKLGTVLFGSVEAAASLINVILAIASIVAFYGIIKNICPHSTKSGLILVTGVYAFSPYILGLVNYLNLDYYCACLFPIVVYTALKGQWVYHILTAALFVFTKEPSIVIYGGFCVGYFVCCEYLRVKTNKKFNLFEICKTVQYWYMLIIAVLWFGTYKLLGPWSAGEGGVGFDILYIQEKLKVMFVYNFSWVISILCFISLICFWRYNYKRKNILLISLLSSLFAFVLFSCVFKTISHYRYNDVLFFLLWTLAAPLCLAIKSKWIRNCGLIGVMTVMLLATYTTIDPVSGLLFDTVNTGNGRMWTISDQKHLGDAIIYNKQGLYSEVVINNALENAISDEDTIIMQSKYNNPWMVDGLCDFAVLDENNMQNNYYWDENSKQRYSLEHDGSVMFVMNHVSTFSDIEKLVNNEEMESTFSYLTIYQDEESLTEEIKKSYQILHIETYQYRNWKIERIRFEK